MSPKPNIAKLLAVKIPFSNISWGNITAIKIKIHKLYEYQMLMYII